VVVVAAAVPSSGYQATDKLWQEVGALKVDSMRTVAVETLRPERQREMRPHVLSSESVSEVSEFET